MISSRRFDAHAAYAILIFALYDACLRRRFRAADMPRTLIRAHAMPMVICCHVIMSSTYRCYSRLCYHHYARFAAAAI